jgi:hypothetical protein
MEIMVALCVYILETGALYIPHPTDPLLLRFVSLINLSHLLSQACFLFDY